MELRVEPFERAHGRTRAIRTALLTACMSLAFIVVPAAANACTISWDGQLGDNWFAFQPNGPGTGDDVYNWSPERYPDGNDDVCFPPGSVASTDLETQNTPTMRSFTISPGATLNITAVQLIAAENSVNSGTLNMSGPVPVTISDGNTGDAEGLTNSGTINFTTGGAAGLRSLHGDLLNTGTINVDHPEASIQPPGAGGPTAGTTQTNQGTIDISPTNALRVLSSKFVHGTGSVINGGGTMDVSLSRIEVSGNSQIAAGTVVNSRISTIAGTAGAASTGNIDVTGGLFQGGGPSTLEGTLPAGITLDLDSTTLIVPPVLTTVNAGRININGNAAQLKVEPNDSGPNSTSKLTNTGTIEFTAGGTAGLRTITGDLVNQGTLLVNHPEASFQPPGGSSSVPVLRNQGALTVSGGNVLRVLFALLVNDSDGLIGGNGTINNEQVVTNNGTVAPGSSPGILTFTADYTQGAGGTLEIEISGAAPFTGHDQLVVGGTATLGGTLSVHTAGFSPATGQQFKIIDAPAPPATSVSGTFATLVPTGGRTYGVTYNQNDVSLSASAPVVPPVDPVVPPADGDGDGVPDASDSCPAQAGPASNGGCPVIASSPPPADRGPCDRARAKLRALKRKLRKLKKQEASKAKTERTNAEVRKAKAKIKRAKARVRKAKANVRKVCA